MMMKKANYLSEKQEFIAVDFFKLVCALLVVTIHIPMFTDINFNLSFWTNQILARIAVPFFFISSGFFVASKIDNHSKVISYCKRILTLYVVYTMLYLPEIICGWLKNEHSIIIDVLAFMSNMIFVGSYPHLWFFAALVTATLILYLSVTKFNVSDKKLIAISSILYVIGVMGDAYRNLFLEVPILGEIMRVYYGVFATTRNGLFFGVPFLSIGYFIYKHKNKIENKLNLYMLLTLLSFLVMNLEEYFAKYITNHHGQDMIFFTPVVSIFLFLSVCLIHTPIRYKNIGLLTRKISVLIFGFHLLIKFYINYLLRACNLELNSLVSYSLIILLNVLLGVILIKLQRLKLFNFIKYLY